MVTENSGHVLKRYRPLMDGCECPELSEIRGLLSEMDTLAEDVLGYATDPRTSEDRLFASAYMRKKEDLRTAAAKYTVAVFNGIVDGSIVAKDAGTGDFVKVWEQEGGKIDGIYCASCRTRVPRVSYDTN